MWQSIPLYPLQLEHYLILSGLLFSLGLLGIGLGRKSIISILMCFELMLLAVNINLVAFSAYSPNSNLTGQVFSLFILTVAAAEAAIGLAILVVYYRNRGTIDIVDISALKG